MSKNINKYKKYGLIFMFFPLISILLIYFLIYIMSIFGDTFIFQKFEKEADILWIFLVLLESILGNIYFIILPLGIFLWFF